MENLISLKVCIREVSLEAQKENNEVRYQVIMAKLVKILIGHISAKQFNKLTPFKMNTQALVTVEPHLGETLDLQ